MVTGNKLRGTLDPLSLLTGLVYLECSSNQRMSRERLPAVVVVAAAQLSWLGLFASRS